MDYSKNALNWLMGYTDIEEEDAEEMSQKEKMAEVVQWSDGQSTEKMSDIFQQTIKEGFSKEDVLDLAQKIDKQEGTLFTSIVENL